MAGSERSQGAAPQARPDAAAPSLELELQAVASSVTAGRHAIRALCDGHRVDHGAIAIAVSEALTNVVVHAYRDSSVGPMRVSATMLADVLRVVVSDDGQGMTSRHDSPGMGTGLVLIDRLAGAVEMNSGDGGTRLEMRFHRGTGNVHEMTR